MTIGAADSGFLIPIARELPLLRDVAPDPLGAELESAAEEEQRLEHPDDIRLQLPRAPISGPYSRRLPVGTLFNAKA